MNQSKCWICGAKASTREHILKASDLRSLFGGVSQQKPLYLHTKGRRNQPIGSVKSVHLKYQSPLCERCNTKRTQPYDRAWERVSAYLSQHPRARRLNLDYLFPRDTQRWATALQLFFVKLLGCRIVDSHIPLSLQDFSYALLKFKPHPQIHLAFYRVSGPRKRRIANITPVQASILGHTTVFAAWFYLVGLIGVNIIYNAVPGNDRPLRGSWQPGYSAENTAPMAPSCFSRRS